MRFNNPEYLWLLLLILPMIYWYVFKHFRSDASLQVSTTRPFFKVPRTKKVYLFHLLFVIRCVILALLIVVIARPQLSNSFRSETTEGIDIMVALDISGTMLAEDLRPNRLEAAKDVAIEFISGRPNDNVGLVVFAGESFTLEDGTAIGLGLANAVNRIKDSEAKSKVVILLTDGSNNAGDVAPLTAAEIAKTFGVRVYTIGVGTHGMARYPFQTPLGVRYQNIPVEIDEDVLQEIASMTGGSYFRATDNSKLREIYGEIDQMEKTKLRVNSYSKKSEEFLPFMIAALVLLVCEMVIRNTVLRRIP